MTIEAAGLCRNGHDLAVLGKLRDGRCKACSRARNARYRVKPGYNIAQKKFRDKPEAKAKRAAYVRSPEGKAAVHRWAMQPAAIARRKAYAETPKGRVSNMRKDLKRSIAQKISRITELERIIAIA